MPDIATPRGVVLVTRPVDQNAALCKAIDALGCRSIALPLIKIQPKQADSSLTQVVARLEQFQHVIFVSKNAIQHGLDLIDGLLTERPTGINWYTVGDASAAALASRGVHAMTPVAEMTSEGLLALPALTEVEGDKVLIIKGEGGRRHLHDALSARGACVEELSVYHRVCPVYQHSDIAAAFVEQPVDSILISSGEGLDNMVSLMDAETLAIAQRCAVVVPGERVASSARQHGFQNIVLADNATDKAMLKALKVHYGIQEEPE